MKTLQIRQDLTGNENIVVLNEDQTAVANKELREMWHSVSYLLENIKNNTLTEGMRFCNLSLLESHFGELAKTLNYESDLLIEKQGRYEEIKAANQEIHDLRKELGKTDSVEKIAAFVKNCYDKLYAYWSKELRMSIVRETSIFSAWKEAYLKAELAPAFSSFHSSFSETPVSDKRSFEEYMEDILKEGLVWKKVPNDRETIDIIDCESSRKWFHDKLRAKFPSAKVECWKNAQAYGSQSMFNNGIDEYKIREIIVRINIEDFKD